jgi:ATP-dependent Clp protease adaptor protein ClpS
VRATKPISLDVDGVDDSWRNNRDVSRDGTNGLPGIATPQDYGRFSKHSHPTDRLQHRFSRHNVLVSETEVLPQRSVDEGTAEHTDVDRPWIVLVWNDPINLMSYVTFVLQKVFGYSKEKATALMLDVHHKGRAVVSSGSRERAEFDVYRLHEHGLWATMQREDNG